LLTSAAPEQAMLTYQYKAATADGGLVNGEMCGKNRNAIVEQLYALGRIPIRIDEAQVRSEKKRRWQLTKQRITDEEIADFTRELSTLLRAGVSLDRALSILSSLTDSSLLRELVEKIHNRVKEGSSLADAIDNQGKTFSRFYVNMLRAGESGGALEIVLERLAEHLEKSKDLRDTLVSALIYPAILVVVALVSILILLGYVVPQFTEMFDTAGEALPLSTRITISVGETVRDYGWLAIPGIAITTWLVRRQLEDPEKLGKFHGWLLRAPIAGQIILKIEVARFARTLATLLENGVTLVKALSIVRDTMSNRKLASGIEQVSDSLREGQSLAEPLARCTDFPTLSIHMIRVGEETGKLEQILMQVASTYDRDTQTTIKRAMTLLEPALILVLGTIIAAVIISILAAILSVNELVI
jgi:general secretion pathway protein F